MRDWVKGSWAQGKSKPVKISPVGSNARARLFTGRADVHICHDARRARLSVGYRTNTLRASRDWQMWTSAFPVNSLARVLDPTGEVLTGLDLPCAQDPFTQSLIARAEDRALARLRACDTREIIGWHRAKVPAVACALALAAAGATARWMPDSKANQHKVTPITSPDTNPVSPDGRLASDLPAFLKQLSTLADALEKFTDSPARKDAEQLASDMAQLEKDAPSSLRARLGSPALASTLADANATPMALSEAAKADAKALRALAGTLGGQGQGVDQTGSGGAIPAQADARAGATPVVSEISGSKIKDPEVYAKVGLSPLEYREAVRAYFEALEKKETLK